MFVSEMIARFGSETDSHPARGRVNAHAAGSVVLGHLRIHCVPKTLKLNAVFFHRNSLAVHLSAMNVVVSVTRPATFLLFFVALNKKNWRKTRRENGHQGQTL